MPSDVSVSLTVDVRVLRGVAAVRYAFPRRGISPLDLAPALPGALDVRVLFWLNSGCPG